MTHYLHAYSFGLFLKEDYMKRYSRHSQTAVKVIQGNRHFYIAAIKSDILAKCCYAVDRDKDPVKGFQRVLSEKRAINIAKYIDNEDATIPTSIILSAKPNAGFKYDATGKKTISFSVRSGSFLILDGQHRLFGFSKANKSLRIPVCIYDDLSVVDEVKLFIDINTTQKGVPRELLLDIQHMAENENETDEQLRIIFDHLSDNPKSPLYGLMSKTSKAKGKVSRVTFNQALRRVIFSETLSSLNNNKKIEAISRYITSIRKVFDGNGKDYEKIISNVTYFKALICIMPEVFSQSIQIHKNLRESSIVKVLETIGEYNFKSKKNFTSVLATFKELLRRDVAVSNEMI